MGSVAFWQFLRAEEKAEENGRLLISESAAKNAARVNLKKFQSTAEELGIRVSEFNQLAASVRYDTMLASARALLSEPAWPSRMEAMEEWARECDELLQMRPRIDQTIKSLRQYAVPWTDERELEFARTNPEAHTRWKLRGELLESLRYAQSIRSGKPIPRIELNQQQRAMSPEELSSMARARVTLDPDVRSIWGEEALGLALARLAREKSKSDPNGAPYLDTLAWALLANGQDADAR